MPIIPSEVRDVSLLDRLRVAEAEGELISLQSGDVSSWASPSSLPCGPERGDSGLVDSEAAATVWLLAQAGLSLGESVAYLRGERMAS